VENLKSRTVHRGRNIKVNTIFVLDFETSVTRKAATVCKLNASKSIAFSPPS
jgi:hypothetical protein